MTEIRCYNCRKLLAVATLQDGRIEIKCPSCNAINVRENLQAAGKVVE